MFRLLVLSAACVFFGATPGSARPARTVAAEIPVADGQSPVRPVSEIVSETPPSCTHTRRRLWLEGEGWVVRKIATCR